MALVVAKHKNITPCMAIKLLIFKDHGYFTAIILNISK